MPCYRKQRANTKNRVRCQKSRLYSFKFKNKRNIFIKTIIDKTCFFFSSNKKL